MRNHEWYKGFIEAFDAEKLLLAKTSDCRYVHPDDAFLVRDKSIIPGDFNLDVKVDDTVITFEILRDDNGKYFLLGEKFDFVHGLITYHRTSSVSRKYTLYLTDMAELDQIVPTDDHLANRNCSDLKTQEWYKGAIGRNDAEQLLLARLADTYEYVQPDGAFLVRDIESSPGDYILSVKVDDTVKHFKMLRDGNGKYFMWVYKFNTVHELITYHHISSVSRSEIIFLKNMSQKRYIAMYDYVPQDCDELLLKEGDEITFISDNGPDWWIGRKCRTYQVGYFPKQYVDEVKKQN